MRRARLLAGVGSQMVPLVVTPNVVQTQSGHNGNQVGYPGVLIVQMRHPVVLESSMHPAPPSRQLST